jgi:putative transposase
MIENEDPLENASVERVNGIIKEEYLNNYQVDDLGETKELLNAVIQLHNNQRPHMSTGNLTLNHVHQCNIKVENYGRIIMKKSWDYKPITGLKMNCKSILRLSINL